MKHFAKTNVEFILEFNVVTFSDGVKQRIFFQINELMSIWNDNFNTLFEDVYKSPTKEKYTIYTGKFVGAVVSTYL